MAQQSLEEVIRIVLQTAGEKDVEKLQSALTDLVKTGDLTEEQLAGLSDALRDFGAAAAVTEGVEQAIKTYGQLAAKQGELADAAEAAGLRLKLASEAEQTAAAVLREKVAAVEQVVAAQREYRDSNETSREGLAAFAKSVRDAKEAQKDASKEYRESASVLGDATKGYDTAATAQERLADGIERAGKTIRDAGENTDDLVGAQQRLEDSAKAAAAGIAALVTNTRATADATRALREKFDEQDAAVRRNAETSKAAAEALAAYEQRAKAAANESANLGAEASNTGGALDKLKGIAAGVFAFFTVDRAVAGLKSILTGASDAEQALGQIDAALASTGRQAEFSAGQLSEMASQLRDTSNFSADQISSAQTRLLSYTNVVGEQFPAALQISIDQAARLGISVESSAEIVGKALQTPSKAMESLAKQGFVLEAGQRELLKTLEATGRTAEAQAIILDLLFESYGGAAAAQRLGTAAGLFKTLQDQIDDLKQSIADAGVFDYFKARLASLGEQVKALAADGSLLEYAKRVSDGIVATAKAVEGAVTFVVRYSGALIELGKAYVAIKFAVFLQGMALSAVRMYEAAKAASVAAGAMGGLRGAMASIVPNLKIAVVAVGIEVILSQLIQLKAAYEDLKEVQSDQIDSNRGLSDVQIKLRQQLDATLAVLGKYRDTVISSREEVDKLTDNELAGYQQRLEAARRYYSAVEISARRSGDAANEALAAERVREYLAELARVAGIFDKIKDGARGAESAQSELRQALRDLGVDAQNAGDQVTTAGQKIITNFALVATEANASAQQIGAAYARAIDQVQTTAEVDKLAQALRVAFESGKISAAEYAKGAEAAAARTRDIKDAAADAAGGFGGLKQSSVDAANAMIIAFTAARDTLVSQSQQIAAAIAAALKSGVKEGSAELQGLIGQSSEIDQRIKGLNNNITETRKGLEQAKAPADGLTDSFNNTEGAANAAGAGVKNLGDSVEKTGEQAKGGVSPISLYISSLEALRAEFGAVSDSALNYFDRLQVGLLKMSYGIPEVFGALEKAAELTRERIAEELGVLEESIRGISSVVEDSERGFNNFGKAVGNSAQDMQQLEMAANRGINAMSLLNEADLARLQAEIDRAGARLKQLKDEAASAKDELTSLADSLQDTLDRRAGEDGAVREREYQKELERISELAAAGGSGALDAANRARALARRNFEADIAEIKERQQADAERAATAEKQQDRTLEKQREINAESRQTSQAANRLEIEGTFRVEEGPGLLKLSPATLEELGRQITPVIIRVLERQRQLSGRGG